MKSTPEPEELFGQRVRRRRKQLGISLRELAERMQQQGHQWHHTTVARTESAGRPVRLNEAVALAGILRMPLFDFLREQRRDDESRIKVRIDDIRERIAEAEDATASADYQYQQAKSQFEVARQALAAAEMTVTERSAEVHELNRELDMLNAKLAAFSDAKRGNSGIEPENVRSRLVLMLDTAEEAMRDLSRAHHPSKASYMTPEVSTAVSEAARLVNHRINDLTDALGRIEDGAYGLCLDCGNEIPDETLRIRPEIAYCAACKPDSGEGESAASANDMQEIFRDLGEREQLLFVWKMNDVGMGIDAISEHLVEPVDRVRAMIEEASAILNAMPERG